MTKMMKMRYKRFWEDFMHVKKYPSWKYDIKNLVKILYFANIFKSKMQYKELEKNLIFSKKFLVENWEKI